MLPLKVAKTPSGPSLLESTRDGDNPNCMQAGLWEL